MPYKIAKHILMISLVFFIIGIYILKSGRYSSKEVAGHTGTYPKDRNKLLLILSQVSSIPPTSPPNHTCTPPPLPTIPSCMNETGLNGERLKNQRNIAVMILFSFEADTLEIAFYQLIDLVDVIFLVEATKTHKGVRNLLDIYWMVIF